MKRELEQQTIEETIDEDPLCDKCRRTIELVQIVYQKGVNG